MTFCFVGKAVGDKGMNELARAFKQLISIPTACRLLLVNLILRKNWIQCTDKAYASGEQ